MTSARRKLLLSLAVVALLAAGLWAARGRVPFDWETLQQQWRGVDWRLVLAGLAAIYISSALRAWRWLLLMGRRSEAGAVALIAPQMIGFTVVALFGRVADLARPYLIARRTRSAVATQLAVYSLERAFDVGAAAVLFSLSLALTPASMPHHEAFVRAGEVSLAATLLLAAFAVAVRFSGNLLAGLARRILRIVSAEFATSTADRILEFRDGLRAIAGAGQFAGAAAWSLLVWLLIAAAYFTDVRAFRNAPALATITVSGTMLLMATSMGGSLLQLPVVGWFTQIGVLTGALHLLLGAPMEAASACAVVLFAVTTLGIVPGGLIAARAQGIALRDAARGSESAGEIADSPEVS